MTLTPEQIEEIAERERKATPGPWEADTESAIADIKFDTYVITDDDGERVCDMLNSDAEIHEGADCDENGNTFANRWDERGRCNADFIAHARTDIPALLASHRELQERVEALEQAARYALGNCVNQGLFALSPLRQVIDRLDREASRLLTTKGE